MQNFLRSLFSPNPSREPSTCALESSPDFATVRRLLPSLPPQSSQHLLQRLEAKSYCAAPELWPSSAASTPSLNPAHFIEMLYWLASSHGVSNSIGEQNPSQLTLFCPSGAPQIRKFKCNFVFVLSWYSMAGDVSELHCVASWSEMQTSWNHEMMRPEGSSQEFRV